MDLEGVGATAMDVAGGGTAERRRWIGNGALAALTVGTAAIGWAALTAALPRGGWTGQALGLFALALLVGALPILVAVGVGRAAGRPLAGAWLPPLVWFVLWTSAPVAHDHHDRNGYARSCGNTLRMAVEQYATDHDGRYPTRAGWYAALTAPGGNYLPGDALPRVWTKRPQDVPLAPPPPLVGAAAIAAGAAPSPEKTDIGPGWVAEVGPMDARSFGAMLYDHDPKTETYVIYAIGRSREKRAVVVAAITNAR